MDSIQSVLLRLLCELHEICEENGIVYCLGGKTALSAARWEEYARFCHTSSIMLDPENFNRLEQVLCRRLPQNRAYEAISTNPKYPFVNAKYVDTSTTEIDLRIYNLVNSPGIGVSICRMVPFSEKNLQSKVAWISLHSQVESRYRKSFFMAKPQATIKKRLFNRLSRTLSSQELFAPNLIKAGVTPDRIYVLQHEKRRRSFSSGTFAQRVPCYLEGHQFWLPAGYDEYLRALFGLSWETRDFHFSPDGLYKIVDFRKPYSAYREALERQDKNLKEFRRLSEKIIPISVARNKKRQEVEKIRHMPERTADRFFLTDSLLPKKEQILSLYRKAQFKELDEMLTEYSQIAVKHLKNKVPFAFDKDLFYVFCDVLNWCGNTKTSIQLLSVREQAFNYLDDTVPGNVSVLGGFLYKYAEDERAFYSKDDERLVCFARELTLSSGDECALIDRSVSQIEDPILLDDEVIDHSYFGRGGSDGDWVYGRCV